MRGVTHSDMSCTTDFTNLTLFDLLAQMGFYLHLSLKRFGFYGSGAGCSERRHTGGEQGYGPGTTVPRPADHGRPRVHREASDRYRRCPEGNAVEKASIPAPAVGIVEVLDADGPGNFIPVYAECDGGARIVQAVSPVYSVEGEYISTMSSRRDGAIGG